MKQSWTLHVENFGKIKEASIEVRPFMIFAGDNNSGKSYLMSLLWGLLNAEEELFDDIDFEMESAEQCLKWFETQLTLLKGNLFIVDEEGQNLLLSWFNEVLAYRKEWLVRRIFNRLTPIGELRISHFKRTPYYVEPIFKDDIVSSSIDSIRIPTADFLLKQSDSEKYRVLRLICWRFFAGSLYKGFTGPAYLPASRTGFMLTYKTLVKDAIKHGYGAVASSSQTTLSWPTNKFLQVLASLEFDLQAPYTTVAEYLQRNVLGGQITREPTPVPTYRYQPTDGHEELPFHATSSLVSELAPLVLYLQSKAELRSALIIEEPEAHLHLEMQKKIAIALARLVNLGLPVWITTHSDTMAQQINNLIQLHQHPNRTELARQFGYDETTDFLDPKSVSAYQFTVKTDGTAVEKLPLTSGGIAFPTFTQSIIAQAKQTIALEEEIQDDDNE